MHQKPRDTVMHLLTLYGKNRFDFVRMLQSYENSRDCTYVTALRKEAEYIETDGTLEKDLEHDMLIVKLELQQAESICKR
jgi:hypothetical protein